MAKSKQRNHTSDGKRILSAQESLPPPRYTSGRQNHAYESDDQSDVQAPPRIQSKAVIPYRRSDQTDSVKPLHRHEIDYNPSGTVQSICLCSASVYPHFHGETIIDNEVYDEILIVDPKELHTTTTNKDVRFKGQCLRLCKLAVIIIIVFAGLACGLYGVAHYFIVNKPGFAMMARADAKLLQYSTYFCEKITTTGAEVERKLTVLERKPAHIAEFNHIQNKTIVLGPGQRTYQHTFYAIEQSVMQIIVVASEDFHVMMFDDKNKLATWINNKNYPAYKFREICCKSVIIGRGIYTFKTKQDKQAFLVIYLPTPITANVSLTLNFKRSFVNYKRSSETCLAKRGGKCSVPISFASKEKVVIEVPKTSQAFDPRKAEWNCEARVWFYVLVFAGIFICIVIVMSLLYCFFKYCICTSCCCFCCFAAQPQHRESPHVVQYHKNPSLKHRAAYSQKTSTPKGPRAEHIKGLKRYDSSDSIDKRVYYTSDSDDQGLSTEEKRLQRKQASRMNSSNSTATTQSFVSAPLSRRRSSLSSIGSDIKKRGMDIDDSYEELPTLNETDGVYVININDSVDGRVHRSRSERRMQANAQRGQDDDLELESRLQRKLAMFTDSDEEEELHHVNHHGNHVSFKEGSKSSHRSNRSMRSHSADDDYDYDVVGSQISASSKSAANVIDILPLGPSGAPPAAPPKSAASIKGKPDFHKPARMMEKAEILPNGFTRDKKAEKVKKTRSDAVYRNGTAKKPPVRANVIVLSGEDKRNAEIYSTYQRGRKNEVKENGIYTRTISLDSGLDKIEGSSRDERRKPRPAADVKF